MSKDEIHQELRKIEETGGLSPEAIRQAARNPLEAEKAVKLNRVDVETMRQGKLADRVALAVLGDKELGVPGLVKDVGDLKQDQKDMKDTINRGIWAMGGIVSLGTFIMALVGLWIEFSKR